jgi:ATP-dependent helicase HrpB
VLEGQLMQPLPIDELLPAIVSALERTSSLVLEAPPGAGKTTRVPRALLDAAFSSPNRTVLVAEPRRIAARLAAHRVAEELGQQPGQTVGYSVRFEDVSNQNTRILYVTDGVLLRRLLEPASLRGVAAIVLDEFHERSLTLDLCLALVRRMTRVEGADLRLVVMSATLDAEPIARYLGGAPRIRSDGKLHPVEIEHLPRPDDRPLEKQVVSAVKRALGEQNDGDVLVFLPGSAEIRRARDALGPTEQASGISLMVLHGDLPIAEQARAVQRGTRRKVILSTNVAESSVTIEGVTAVVDSGLSRIAEHSPWSGLPRLTVAKVSRASTTQRAGRAGRTRPGRVYRLFTESDHAARPERDAPEILRADLSDALLSLAAAGVDVDALDWLDPPRPAALSSASELLQLLGALGTDGAVTEIGRRMARLPVHPRLARIVIEAEDRGVIALGCLAAALLGERDLRLYARAQLGGAPRDSRARAAAASGDSDVVELVDRFREAEDARFDRSALDRMGVDRNAALAVDRARRQLLGLAHNRRPREDDPEEAERLLGLCLLTGFADRVARRRASRKAELIVANGSSARLADTSVVHDAMLLVAVSTDEQERGRAGGALVRLASAIEPEWLLDLYSDRLSSRDELEFNPKAERVERTSELGFGSVVLEQSKSVASPGPEVGQVLARAALARGLGHFPALAEQSSLVARLGLLATAMPELGVAAPGDDALSEALVRGAERAVSFDELRELDWRAVLSDGVPARAIAALARHVPERVTLPGGRSVAVHYESGKPAWIESRLQDFFGLADGPRICDGRLALTLHLLAPNRRPVQITQDLAGFWVRHYPQIRQELKRRYPKHAWPEDGKSAKPP